MKFYSALTQFKYSWDQVAVGFWFRYPNPQSTHVVSEDIIHQTVLNGKLFTKRLLTKTGSIPKWGERFVNGANYVYIIEESIVDPKTKTLTTYTRNIGSSAVVVEEKCIYKENSEWTDCQRQAFVESKYRGISYALQTFVLEKYKLNISKSVKGFNHVLNMLYPIPQVMHQSSNKQKLKDTAEAAKKLASTVVAATN